MNNRRRYLEAAQEASFKKTPLFESGVEGPSFGREGEGDESVDLPGLTGRQLHVLRAQRAKQSEHDEQHHVAEEEHLRQNRRWHVRVGDAQHAACNRQQKVNKSPLQHCKPRYEPTLNDEETLVVRNSGGYRLSSQLNVGRNRTYSVLALSRGFLALQPVRPPLMMRVYSRSMWRLPHK